MLTALAPASCRYHRDRSSLPTSSGSTSVTNCFWRFWERSVTLELWIVLRTLGFLALNGRFCVPGNPRRYPRLAPNTHMRRSGVYEGRRLLQNPSHQRTESAVHMIKGVSISPFIQSPAPFLLVGNSCLCLASRDLLVSWSFRRSETTQPACYKGSSKTVNAGVV